jgi:hypothetical protein
LPPARIPLAVSYGKRRAKRQLSSRTSFPAATILMLVVVVMEGSSYPGGFTEFNGWLFFTTFLNEPRLQTARFVQTGRIDEFWRTNGIDTEKVTVLESGRRFPMYDFA